MNQTVDIEIVPKDKRFLLDTWGLIDCSKNSLLCRLNMTDNLTLKIKGQNAISLHDDFIEFSRADRSNVAGSDLLPAEISLPDRIFLSKGIAANKRVIFKFESGSCVYDGNIDICGVAHCDPTKVLTLRSCEINDQKYKYLVDGSGHFDLPEPVRLKEVQLQGRLKLDEVIELSFEFPVHEWKYEENDFKNQNILN